MKLTPEQERLLPSAEDIAFYDEHGYYISPPFLSEDEVEDAIYGAENFWAGERDIPAFADLKSFEGWQPGDGDGLRLNDYVSLQNQEIAALVHHPLIGATAARLARCSRIRLWHDQLIYKPPTGPEEKVGIGWHTDYAYWHTCSSRKMLTAWVPLVNCDEAIGTLNVVDGSHRWSGNEHLRGFHDSDLESLEGKFNTNGHPVVKVPLNLRKGQVSFHHCLTLHGSGPNHGDRARLSLSIHFQDGDNRYREPEGGEGHEAAWHRNDILCRKKDGKPDYSDPDICPEVWSIETLDGP